MSCLQNLKKPMMKVMNMYVPLAEKVSGKGLVTWKKGLMREISALEKKVSVKGPAPWKKSLLREISALEKKVSWMGSVPWRKKSL